VNASTRVAEILRLVGLDRILLAEDAVRAQSTESCFAQPAA